MCPEFFVDAWFFDELGVGAFLDNRPFVYDDEPVHDAQCYVFSAGAELYVLLRALGQVSCVAGYSVEHTSCFE